MFAYRARRWLSVRLFPEIRHSQALKQMDEEEGYCSGDEFDPPTIAVSPDRERLLLERLEEVGGWVREFCVQLGKSKAPEVRTKLTSGSIGYSPLGHLLIIPQRQLTEISDSLLRIVVAHEIGHAMRRWRGFIATAFPSVARLMDEEMHADRFAVQLTGATIEQWEGAMVAVLAIEEPGAKTRECFAFQARKQVLQSWLRRNAATTT